MIHGGTIKGNATYSNGCLSYLDLKNELPFPTKMVVVRMALTPSTHSPLDPYIPLAAVGRSPCARGRLLQVRMPGAVLEDAIDASRTGDPETERRSYLQVDGGVEMRAPEGSGGRWRVGSVNGKAFAADQSYAVALPRNLLKGAFKIAPLVAYAQAHPEALPASDDIYLQAMHAVVMHHAHSLWLRLGSFEEMDVDGDGELTREEIRCGLEAKLGQPPSQLMLDYVIAPLDKDGDVRARTPQATPQPTTSLAPLLCLEPRRARDNSKSPPVHALGSHESGRCSLMIGVHQHRRIRAARPTNGRAGCPHC